MTNERLKQWLVPTICLIFAIALPFFIPTYYVQFISKALIMGTLAMALNLVVGHGGLVSLCHAAFFGLSGYVLALASPRYDAASLLLTLPLAVLASAAAALVIGALALRTRGIAFINVKPEFSIAGVRLLDLDKPLTFYFVVLAAVAGVTLLLVMLVRSPFGHALAAARDNERRARSLGFPIFRIRLTAFVISGALAGVAGYLAAAQFGFVAPQMLGWHQSATVLVMVLIGGLRSVTGPLVGALVLIGLEEVLKANLEHWKLAEGLFIIAIVVALPGGVRQIWPMIFGPREDRGEVRPAAAEAHHG
jgi:branched-chain amino acid transport system permease protein